MPRKKTATKQSDANKPSTPSTRPTPTTRPAPTTPAPRPATATPATAGTAEAVTEFHKDQVEGLREAARQADRGMIPGTPLGVPPTPPDKRKEATRLFEVSPGNKVWLTEAEATARGFFWSPVGADYKVQPAAA